MTKRLIILTLSVAGFLMCPTIAQAESIESIGVEQIEEKSDVQINVSQAVVHITNAEGQVMEVISLTGRHVMSVRIESPAQKIELTNISKGCYIIKVGKVVRKIVI